MRAQIEERNIVVYLLLTLVTCGIYGIYFSYQMGKYMVKAGENYNVKIEDNSILYLILTIFGFGIVSYCLVQNDLNTIAKTKGPEVIVTDDQNN